jgi:Astacin (Peptidase family M12A)
MGVGITGNEYLWPRRTVPFEIEPGFPNPQRVLVAIQHWNEHSSIRFVPRSGEVDHVLVARLPGKALSDVGRRGGQQKVQLGDGTPAGNIIHELGHVVGLWHEHCRNDRDEWVHIDFDNIAEDDHPDFEQNSVSGVPTPMTDRSYYDYGSIMHYGPKACALYEELPVITPKKEVPAGVEMGQRVALSAGDLAAVEEMYTDEPMPTEAANAAALAVRPAAAPAAPVVPAPVVPASREAAAPPAAAAPPPPARGRPSLLARIAAAFARIRGRLRGKAPTVA